jgi:hypothetical protein
MSYIEVLRRVAARLESAAVPYMVTGSVAASYYGLVRATQDLVVVISANPDQLRELLGLFPSAEYYAPLQDALDAHRHQSMFNVLDMSTGWKIDFIFQKGSPFHREAFRRRKDVAFEGVPTSMISLEDLILSKLEWSKMGESERQIRDAASVMQKRWSQLDRTYIENWVEQLGLIVQWSAARKTANLQ